MDAFVIRSKRKIEHEAEEIPLKCTREEKQVLDSSQTQASVSAETTDGEIVSDSPIVPIRRIEELKWRKISKENLSCDYCILYSKQTADDLFRQCESKIEYNTGELAKVQVFGKWHDIPRKQVAYGDAGLSYKFSGTEVPAREWPWFIASVRDTIQDITGQTFNFVLINRYADGNDHMGEHRDDEKELVMKSPIASLTLGQPRDFVFRHADTRGKNASRKIDPVTIELEHGGLLMMNYPTNTYWYHSLPKRKRAPGVRINFTFRHFVTKKSNVQSH